MGNSLTRFNSKRRLDIYKQEQEQQLDSNNNCIMEAQKLDKLISRLELATERLEKMQSQPSVHHATAAPVQDASANSPSVLAYDALTSGALRTFLDNSSHLNPDLKTIADMVKKLFDLERHLIVEAARCAKPASDVLPKAFEPLSKQIQEISAFREKNRKSEFFNHLSAVSEAIGALGWVAVEPAPCPYIKEMSDAGQFYTNRVLKDFREKDKAHPAWVQSWLQLLNELQAYVKQYHTTGLAWNPRGAKFDPNSATHAKPAVPPKPSSLSAAKGGAPAPPPPPMPTFDMFADDSTTKKSDANSVDALAKLKQELNKGADITKTLKKVSDDQKTHKNPSIRAGSTVPAAATSPATKGATPTPAQVVVQKPPVFELRDKKWCIENQVNNSDLAVTNTEIKQTVYIYKCKNCTVKVQGKVNSISLDSCDRVALLFDDVLATVEFVNSKNVQAQVTGKVPTISIDKTDGCQFYLSAASLEAEIITAKSSAVNILLPPTIQGDDFSEHPIPEQYKTVFVKGKPVTTAVESG